MTRKRMFAEMTTDELRAAVDRAYREAVRSYQDARAFTVGDDDLDREHTRRETKRVLMASASDAQMFWIALRDELDARDSADSAGTVA